MQEEINDTSTIVGFSRTLTIDKAERLGQQQVIGDDKGQVSGTL